MSTTNTKSILNPKFKYTPAVATNIVETFKKYGWVPPTERKNVSKVSGKN